MFSPGLLGLRGSLTLTVFPCHPGIVAFLFSFTPLGVASSFHLFSYCIPLSCWNCGLSCPLLLLLLSLGPARHLCLCLPFSPPGTPSSVCPSAIEWRLFGDMFGPQHLIFLDLRWWIRTFSCKGQRTRDSQQSRTCEQGQVIDDRR